MKRKTKTNQKGAKKKLQKANQPLGAQKVLSNGCTEDAPEEKSEQF